MLTSLRAIRLAADESERVNSIATTLSEQVGDPVIATIKATVKEQLRPTLLADVNMYTTWRGFSQSQHEFLSATALYLQTPQPDPGVRPWTEFPFSELGHSLESGISSLLQSAQNTNPAQQTQLLTTSKNVHVVGTQVVDGVETTHYRGTISAATAFGSLQPAVRNGLAAQLKLITGTIHFDVWIDAHHMMRRLVSVETAAGKPLTATENITAVNEPVRITLPTGSQVGIMPASALGGFLP